jgi:pimeloyl-ACP methyl ester carboxylesterase
MGIKKANICGQLTGSGIAGELAAVQPKMTDKLIFLGAALYSPEERDMFIKHPHFTERFQIKEDPSFLTPIWETNRTGAPNMRAETIYRMFVANLLAGPRLHDAHLAAFRYDKAPRLPLIKSPVLVITGDGDMFYKKLEEVKKLIPRCKSIVVPGKTFSYCYDKPKELSELILDFLKNPGV